MGQYFRIANLDKREFLNPYELDSGAKAWEQAMNLPAKALLVLLGTGMGRGGGDFPQVEGVNGRWAGDRIVFVGDYAEDDDLPSVENYHDLYDELDDEVDGWTNVSYLITDEFRKDFL